MKRRCSILLIIVALLLMVPLLLVIWPAGPLDLSKDEEPFRSMVLPPQSVAGDIIMDGGSVGIDLIDKTGVQYELHFYIDGGRVFNSHPTAHYRTVIDRRRIPLKDPARAKEIAIHFLKDYGPKGDMGTARALNGLSNRIGDIGERLYQKAENQFHEWAGF